MKCPFCGDENTVVKNSRPSDDSSAIRRRRSCTVCDSRFTTLERVQLREMYVIKKNGEKRLFDREKIYRSIGTAVRKRFVHNEKIDELVNNISRKFELLGDQDIPTSLIGQEIMLRLSELDQVAYVRFASVYNDFHNAKDFEKFIKQLKHEVKS